MHPTRPYCAPLRIIAAFGLALMLSVLQSAVVFGQDGFGPSPISSNRPPSSQTKVLLLRNGQALSGHIVYEGNHYRVALPTGEIRVRVVDVEHLCRDLRGAFVVKRTKIEDGDVVGMMRLSDWCVEHQLYSEAEALISSAEQTAPAEARVRLARRNLQLAQNPVRSSPTVPTLAKSLEYDRNTLDALTRQMPHGSVESFRKTVQPMLLAGCAAARCHGSTASNEFRLIRPSRGHIITRRATQRNLQAVLRWIEADESGKVPILSKMSEAHGGGDPSHAVGDTYLRPQQHDRTAAWIRSVLAPNEAEVATRLPKPRTALSQAVELGEEAVAPPRTGVSRSSASASPVDGKDDWDAAIFNRQHHPPADTSK